MGLLSAFEPGARDRLLDSGRLEKKVDYLLRRVASLRPIWELSVDFDLHLRQLVQVRNRVVHMKSLWQPKKMASILNPKQIAMLRSWAWRLRSST